MKKLILILWLFFFTFSCSKTENSTPEAPNDQLPAITIIGANTGGCIINGKVIIPKNTVNSTSGFPVYGLRYSVGPNFGLPNFTKYFSINITNLKSTGKSYWIYIQINDMTLGAGSYTVGQSNADYGLNGPNTPQIIVRETFDNVSGKTFISGANSGVINVTRFDFQNSVISGTFSATLYNQVNSSEIIQVTDGRFDIRI